MTSFRDAPYWLRRTPVIAAKLAGTTALAAGTAFAAHKAGIDPETAIRIAAHPATLLGTYTVIAEGSRQVGWHQDRRSLPRGDHRFAAVGNLLVGPDSGSTRRGLASGLTVAVLSNGMGLALDDGGIGLAGDAVGASLVAIPRGVRAGREARARQNVRPKRFPGMGKQASAG